MMCRGDGSPLVQLLRTVESPKLSPLTLDSNYFLQPTCTMSTKGLSNSDGSQSDPCYTVQHDSLPMSRLPTVARLIGSTMRQLRLDAGADSRRTRNIWRKA
jgi:hypothetical protein